MESIAFPNMISASRTMTFSDHEATLSNLKLLLASDRNSLYGDPYYGTNLKRVIFEQNNIILQDLIIDEIYTCIITFMPQLIVQRKDITLKQQGNNIIANIKAINLLDYEPDMYEIKLLNADSI